MNDATERQINSFLQKDVVFYINRDKPLKSGKLLIFKFKDFYFNFVLKIGTTNKIFEIPYPFKIIAHENSLEFSYTLEDFSQKNLDLYYKSLLLKPKKKNKLYNSTVVLSALN